ncbi:DMT family transporter [Streptomyces mirabilis]|uniref:DMT family transporter n=1 Tax=Streptomyces mirabilis TaxID=68239 RepID=UPI003327BCA3
MLIAVSLVCAVLAAASNAVGNVMQRRAALIVPRSDRFRIGLMWDLLRTPVWVLGIGGVILAALFQGAALATGPLAVVQPVFLLELPFTLLVAGIAFRHPMPRATWLSVGSIVVSLCLGLFAAAPGGGTLQAPASLWTAVMTCCLGAMAVLCALAVRRRVGPSRAACMALAAAIGYALTAALMKSSTDTLSREGIAAFFTTWQTYAFAATGVCSLFLLENALQSGPLVASQPALTLGDALVSLTLGITLYGETLRGGWWLPLQLLCLALAAAGVTRLSRNHALSGEPAGTSDTATPADHETATTNASGHAVRRLMHGNRSPRGTATHS